MISVIAIWIYVMIVCLSTQITETYGKWYTVPATRYSNILFDDLSIIVITIIVVIIKIIMMDHHDHHDDDHSTSQASSFAGRSHAPRSPQGLLSRSASPGFKEFEFFFKIFLFYSGFHLSISFT